MIDTGGRRHRRPGGAKLWVGFAAVCAVSALLGEASYYGYRFYCETANEGFLKGTTAEGEDIYGLTVTYNMMGIKKEVVSLLCLIYLRTEENFTAV